MRTEGRKLPIPPVRNTSQFGGLAEVKTSAKSGVTRTGWLDTLIAAPGQEKTLALIEIAAA